MDNWCQALNTAGIVCRSSVIIVSIMVRQVASDVKCTNEDDICGRDTAGQLAISGRPRP
jgi:hypothetical protein